MLFLAGKSAYNEHQSLSTSTSIIYFLRLIPQVGENGAAREPCQRRRPTPKAEGLRRRLAGGRSPQGGREGGDSRECCCQSPVRGESLRRRPKACRRAKSRGREGIAGEREQANLYQMVGGQRPPLPQGSVSERERQTDKQRETETDRETERDRERKRETEREREKREGVRQGVRESGRGR